MAGRRLRRGPRGSALDRLVRRFQHRWETDRRYRALMSGTLALVMVVVLCVTTGTVAVLANSALTALGIGSATSPTGPRNAYTGTSALQANARIPTPTVSLPNDPTPVPSPIPPSQTPAPNATATATATPSAALSPTSTSQGPVVCSGSSPAGSFSLSPCPQAHGQNGTLTIAATGYPNAGLNIVFNLGSCTDGCTLLWTPGYFTLNGNGSISIGYHIPNDANSGTPISGMINICANAGCQNAPTIAIAASPVQ